MLNETLVTTPDTYNPFTTKLKELCMGELVPTKILVKLRNGFYVEVEYCEEQYNNDDDSFERFKSEHPSLVWYPNGQSYKNFDYDLVEINEKYLPKYDLSRKIHYD
jgi:hypothetical protein